MKSSTRAGSDIVLSAGGGQNKNNQLGFSNPLPNSRPQVSMSLSTCVTNEKKPLSQFTIPLKRAAGDERTQPEKKKPDVAFLLPSAPPVRISRMSGLSAEQHERIAAANAKKIEAVKLTMNEVLPTKQKRPASSDLNAPPRKRGRPKGSVNKPRMNGAQASHSLAGPHSRGVIRNGVKTEITSRSIGTQSCLDLSDRNHSGSSTLQTHSTMDINKPTKEFKEVASIQKIEASPQDEVDDMASSEVTKVKPAVAGRDRPEDSSTAVASPSNINEAQPSSNIMPTLSENSYSDGDMTPPLSIVEDYIEQQKSPPRATEPEPQSAAPPTPQIEAAVKKKPQPKKKQKDHDFKILSLTKELNSLISSCGDQEKLKIACSLQRIISEQRDVQQVMETVNRIQAQLRGRSDKDEMTAVLNEYTKKCDEKLNASNNTLLSVQAELSRVGDQCSSLRQASLKHTNEIEAVRTTLKTSCDSLRQIVDELSTKMEALTRERENQRTNLPDQLSPRNLHNFPGFFPPPPPPPPPLQQPKMNKECENRQQDGSSAESPGAANRQQSSSLNRRGDGSAGSVASDLSRAMVNQPPLFPIPTPFYGPFLPPPQKMMYDYHLHMHHLHQQMQHSLTAPLPPFLPMMDGNPLGAQFPVPAPAPVPAPVSAPISPAANNQRNQRMEGLHSQRYQCRSGDSGEFSNKSRRRPEAN
ncbi:unnamed protein product [Haemonchus placei]|uniref:Uncharacterized protein n=1 Tax=Haemonchus placei TaxID=6290 RepID=A0A3P8A7Q6_HAEPC|nr:unnamed protein product [Haemonchus placei]